MSKISKLTLPVRRAPKTKRRALGLVIAVLPLILISCDRESAELTALREENERLKKAIEETRGTSATPTGEGAETLPASDLDLSLAELWSQRFEDNQFRARQRLDQKQMRLTGLVESVSERSVTIFGSGTRFGSVSVLVQLDDAYIKQIVEGLGALQKGAPVTVQGRFLFDKMWLESAVFVDRGTGKRLVSKDLISIAGAEDQPPQVTTTQEEIGKNK